MVSPQAIRLLWPITTPGIPAKPKPATSNGQAADGLVQCRPTWVQTPGIETLRCGSLARMGRPLAVRSPLTTQELEPMPSPPPSRLGSAETALSASSKTCWASSLCRICCNWSGSEPAFVPLVPPEARPVELFRPATGIRDAEDFGLSVAVGVVPELAPELGDGVPVEVFAGPLPVVPVVPVPLSVVLGVPVSLAVPVSPPVPSATAPELGMIGGCWA